LLKIAAVTAATSCVAFERLTHRIERVTDLLVILETAAKTSESGWRQLQ
jgi:hypothetical protein